MALKSAPHLEPESQNRSNYEKLQQADDSSVGFGGGAPAQAKTAEAAKNVGQSTVRGLWEYQGSRPSVIGSNNYTTQGDSVRAIDTRSGKVLWDKPVGGDARKLGGHLATPPAFAAGKLVVGTTTGAVVGYDAQSGKELFRHVLGEQIRFQPALSGGRIYVGTMRGTLVSIETGDRSLDGWTMWGGGPRHNGHEPPAP